MVAINHPLVDHPRNIVMHDLVQKTGGQIIARETDDFVIYNPDHTLEIGNEWGRAERVAPWRIEFLRLRLKNTCPQTSTNTLSRPWGGRRTLTGEVPSLQSSRGTASFGFRIFLQSFLRKGVSLGYVGKNDNLKDPKGFGITFRGAGSAMAKRRYLFVDW